MAIRVIDDTKLQNIAVAIQSKDNGGQMTVDQMAGRIEAIPEGIDMTVTDNQIKMLVYIHPAIRHCYVNFVQTVANDVEVGWGDGTAVDSSPSIGNGHYSCAVISHNYNSDGLRIITLTAKQGILHALDTSVGFIMFAGAPISTVDGDTFPNNYYRNAIVGIAFGENTYGKVECCSALLFIYGLKNVSGAYNPSLSNLTLSSNIMEMPLLMETNIRNIIIPSAIRTFRSNCLRNCTFLKIVDFTYYSISELSQCVFGSNMFTNTTNNGLIILFKDQETADYAKTITNLSTWSRYIKYVGEV